jgi:transposase
VLDGKVIGRCMQQHRHQEFIRFLNVTEAAVPKGKAIHAIVDNYATHKHPTVQAWLARHPRWTFHFTPTPGIRVTYHGGSIGLSVCRDIESGETK